MARLQKPLLRQLEIIWDAIESGATGVGPQGPPGPKGDKGDKGDPGDAGTAGAPGADGQAGPKGDPGERGEIGPKGDTGNDGIDGASGAPGADGPSAYQVAVASGYQGNEAQWLASLVGPKGDKGDQGDVGQAGSPGLPGTNGSDGNDGSPGVDGDDGLSAYQVAVANGFVGNESAWLLSLKGAKGDTGDAGPPGQDGADGSSADPWTVVRLASDFVSNSATSVAVTGLAFTPVANKRYEFEAKLRLRTATATVGPRPGMNWPTGTTDGGVGIWAPNSATAEAIARQPAGVNAMAASTGVPNTTASWPGFISGEVQMGGSPSGAVQVTLASETAGTNVTIKAGSFLRYREIA